MYFFQQLVRGPQVDTTGQDENSGRRVPMGAYVEPAMHERLREVAKEEDRSVSSVVRRALDDYLNRASEQATVRPR